jgi:hypothetical protein
MHALFRSRPRWLFDARTDLVIAWCWVPFFAVAHLFTVRTGIAADESMRRLFTWVLLGNLLHQPLTLLLVYGDRHQFAQRRWLFLLTPVVGVVLVGVAVGLDLWVIVPIAALWQTIHTLQQRYGLLRIYARKSGYGGPSLDRAALFVPFLAVVALVAVLPVTQRQLARFGGLFDTDTAHEVDLLMRARPALTALLVPLAIAAVTVLVHYLRQERAAVADGAANPVKWSYLGSVLLLTFSLLVDPLAGLIAMIASHAIEYSIVVMCTLRSRYANRPQRTSLLSTLAGTTSRRWILLAAFLTGCWLLDDWMRTTLAQQTYLIALYTVGLLHFVYDALIWKVRRPAVARDFGIPRQRAEQTGKAGPVTIPASNSDRR